jgi:hypothetical protein
MALRRPSNGKHRANRAAFDDCVGNHLEIGEEKALMKERESRVLTAWVSGFLTVCKIE